MWIILLRVHTPKFSTKHRGNSKSNLCLEGRLPEIFIQAKFVLLWILGFPKVITDFVGGHVSAKRYLVHKKPGYYESKVLYFIIYWKTFWVMT